MNVQHWKIAAEGLMNLKRAQSTISKGAEYGTPYQMCLAGMTATGQAG